MEPGVRHAHRNIAEAIFRESAGLALTFLEGHLDLMVLAAGASWGPCGPDGKSWYSATVEVQPMPNILRVSL